MPKLINILLILNFCLLNKNIYCQSNEKISFRNCPLGYGGENCGIECGKAAYVDDSKAIGASEAKANISPSTVFLLSKYVYFKNSTEYLSFFCGGNLIDESTVLTVAHCVQDRINLKDVNPKLNKTLLKLDSVYAFLGMHNTKDVNDFDQVKPPGKKIKVDNIIMHEKYDSVKLLNDVALLKLSQNVELNNYVQIACLPQSNIQLKPDSEAVTFGWGMTAYPGNGNASDVLMQSGLSIYDKSECKKVATNAVKDWKTQICAGDIYGKKDTCLGDSGGPLFIKKTINGFSKFVLVGLTSYSDSEGCAIKDKPSIFTKVNEYIGWINDQLL